MFKRMLVAAVLTAIVALPGISLADDTPAAAAGPAASTSLHSFAGNVGLFSQYIFRGLTQTNEKPAMQGGFDYAYNFGSTTGYIGTWASNISWLVDEGQYQSSSLENDWYAGLRGNFGASDFAYDVGFLYYYYPGTIVSGGQKGDTQEIYGLVGWKWLTAKLSYSIGNSIFAVRNARGTYYLDISANYPIGASGFTANLHYGDQKYTGTDGRFGASNDSLFTYSDWKLGFSYDASKLSPVLANVTVGAFYTDTNAKAVGYTNAEGRNIGKSQTTLFVQKTI